MIRVAVIGAGAAGLCVGRYLVSQPEIFSTTIFEQTLRVGGTWVYDENTGLDENGLPVHSSMYKNLKTNLPKQVMAFPDFAFPDEVTSYLTHTQVCKYLEDYAEHFSVQQHIQYNTAVEKVSPLVKEDEEKEKWEVTVKNLENMKLTTRIFDAVVVCNGHYSAPKLPDVVGLKVFPGLVMHSHEYRHPEEFANMNVVVLGSGSSGQDIALDLATTSHNVYLSHYKKRIAAKLPDNVEQHKGIKELLQDGRVHFEDGQERNVDAVIFCTGYDYTFPFLDDQCGIKFQNNRVTPLYKHILNIKYPSMSFLGLGIRICPFPQFSVQSRLVVAVLTGNSFLPSRVDMLANEEKDFQEKVSDGLPEHYAHYLGPKQWDYNNEIAEMAKCDKLDPIVEKLYEYTWWYRSNELMTYKNREFHATSRSTWEEVEPQTTTSG